MESHDTSQKIEGAHSDAEMSVLKKSLVETTLAAIQRAEQFYQIKLPAIEFDFSLRGQCAGQMKVQRQFLQKSYTIRLNLNLARGNRQAFFNDVIPHEIAHFVIFHFYGIKPKIGRQVLRPHGPEWQAIMLECFHRDPKIYHDFEVPQKARRRSLQTFLYICQCREHELSIIRHKKVLQQGAEYRCRYCKDPLKQKVMASIIENELTE